MDAKFAYFLGWMYSDGCITFDKRYNSSIVKIKILKTDEETLRIFSDITDWNFSYEKGRYVCMRKNSNELVSKLIKYGVLPHKSMVNHMSLRRPKAITDNLMPYFIRGYFDGNGYYTWDNIKTYMLSCGCAAQCLYLFKDFQLYLKSNGIKSELRECRPNMYRLRIRTRPDVKKFVDLVFKDHLDLVLHRKYDKVKIYLNNYHTTSELQSRSSKKYPSPFSNPDVHKKAMETRKQNFLSGKTLPSMTGKHHAQESKKKISESNKAHFVHVKQGELLETPEGNETTV